MANSANQHLKHTVLENGWHISQEVPHPLVPEAWQAAQRISKSINRTELQVSKWLSLQSGGGNVYLKLENTQVTGSFKARGATNKVLSLTPEQLRGGIVTASSGNHALAVIHACKAASASGGQPVVPTVYVPESISSKKAEKLRGSGAELVFVSNDAVEAEREARRVAQERGMLYISPYNDLQVAAGQGTIGIEVLSVLKAGDLDAVFVPVGGGGLISGISAVLASVSPHVKVIGCQPEASDVMRQSVAAGTVLDVPSDDTLSDGTAGGVEAGAITLEPCMRFVDQWVTVSEQEIAEAMLGVQAHDGQTIEGAAGVAVASYLKLRPSMQGKNVVIISCGGNVSEASIARAQQLASQ